MIYAIIDERQSGKTQLAIDLWLADPENTILYVPKYEIKNILIKRMEDKFDPKNIANITQFHKNAGLGRSGIKKVIIDELFWRKDWKKDFGTFLTALLPMGVEEVYLIGSYKDKVKDSAALSKYKPLYSTVKEFRQNHFWNSEVLKNFEQFYDEQEEQQNEEL